MEVNPGQIEPLLREMFDLSQPKQKWDMRQFISVSVSVLEGTPIIKKEKKE